MIGRLIVMLLGCFSSFYYWPHEDNRPNQIQCFKSTNQLCMLDLVYEMMIVVGSPKQP